MTKPPVLVAVLEYGELPELLRVAGAAATTLETQAIFLFAKRSYRRLAEDTAEVVARGFCWLDADGHLHASAAPPLSQSVAEVPGHEIVEAAITMPRRANPGSLWSRLRAIALVPMAVAAFLFDQGRGSLRAVARELANLVRDIRQFRRRYRQLDRMLADIAPSLLIVGQDTLGTELSFLLIAAGRRRIPRLITPFAMFSIRETAEFAVVREAYQARTGVLNRVVARAFPHWVLSFRGLSLLRLPGYRALALELAGLVGGLPWSPLSEPCEAITADSRVAANALAALGIERDRIQVVGSPVQDRLTEQFAMRSQLKAELCDEYGLDRDRSLVVCGWPANIFPWLGGRVISYPDYPALATAWARLLAGVRDRHGVNIIISIHPKTLPEEYAAAERLGLPCRLGDSDRLVAACDLFTTLNGSSITAWAIACGLPVLIFDCFLTRYDDFLGVPGCIVVETEEAFAEELDALCADPSRRATLAARQRQAAADWGVLDGHAVTRLCGLIAGLVPSGQS